MTLRTADWAGAGYAGTLTISCCFQTTGLPTLKPQCTQSSSEEGSSVSSSFSFERLYTHTFSLAGVFLALCPDWNSLP